MRKFNFMQLVATGNKLADSKFVQGILLLISDAMKVLIILTAAATGLIFAYNLIMQKLADDNEKPKYKKGWKQTLIIGVAVMGAETIVTLVFGYFA